MEALNPHLTTSGILVIAVWVGLIERFLWPTLNPFGYEVEEDEWKCDDSIVRENNDDE